MGVGACCVRSMSSFTLITTGSPDCPELDDSITVTSLDPSDPLVPWVGTLSDGAEVTITIEANCTSAYLSLSGGGAFNGGGSGPGVVECDPFNGTGSAAVTPAGSSCGTSFSMGFEFVP